MSQAVQTSNLNAPTDREVAFRESMARLSGLLRNGLSISGHERNCCFLNTQAARFANISSASGLDSSGDGRAYGLVDWDHDGDLDLWATCRTSPRVQFLRNNSNTGKHFVKLLLQGNGTTTNSDAIGARVELVMANQGKHKSIKTLHAGQGFLSQSSKWLHFGIADQQQIGQVKVHWPGGETETFSDLNPDSHYLLVQSSGVAKPWSRPAPVTPWQASQSEPLKTTDQARIPLRNRIPLPSLHYETMDGTRVPLEIQSGSPTLVNLWASWCQPCLAEMAEFEKHHEQLDKTGLQIVALSIDELADNKASNATAARSWIEKQRYPFHTGMATENLVGNLESVLFYLFEYRRPWAVPTSFLLDGHGRLSVVYVGPVELEQLMQDVSKLEINNSQWLESSLPLGGRWSGESGYPNLAYMVKTFLDEGYEDSAVSYIERYGDSLLTNPRLPKLLVRIGLYLQEEEKLTSTYAPQKAPRPRRERTAIEYFQAAAKLDPNSSSAHFELASAYESLQLWEKAAQHFQLSVDANPEWATSRIQLALMLLQLERPQEAAPHLQKAMQVDPTLAGPHYHLASILLESDQLAEAILHFRKAYRLEPNNLATVNGLAWTLAIKPTATKEETTEAVRLGEQAAEMTENRHPQILDTLGAAYAAHGQFDKAIATANKAVQLATKSGSKGLAAEIRGRIQLYRRQRPMRESHER